MVADVKPLVSIVTPSLNQGAFIEAAIKSVLEQDYPRIEHIVIDGGSTDGTLGILGRYPLLRWVSEPDRGQSDALNKGFRMATGEIFAWLNADDLYLPGAVGAAVRELQETGCGLVHGGWRQIDETGTSLGDVAVKRLVYRDLLEVHNMVAQPSTFFTRAAFEAVGGVDTRYHYAMDYDLWLKLAERYDVREIDRTLAAFRIHDQAKSSAEADRFWPEVRRISRRHGGRFFTRGYIDYRFARHPTLWRSRMAYRFVAAGEYGELISRAAAKFGLRSR